MKIMKREDNPECAEIKAGSSETGIYVQLVKQNVQELEGGVIYGIDVYPEVYAYMNEEGEAVASTIQNEQLCEKQEKIDEKMSSKVLTTRTILTLSMLIAFALSILFAAESTLISRIFSGLGFILVGLRKIPDLVYAFVMRLLGDELIKQKCRYHSAEHAAVNAYIDLGRAPTLEEIKKYSCFSYDCGVALKMRDSWAWFIVGVARMFPAPFSIITLVVLFLFSIWAFKQSLYFTEIVTLEIPTEKEYKVAIAAFEKAVELYEKDAGTLQNIMMVIS